MQNRKMMDQIAGCRKYRTWKMTVHRFAVLHFRAPKLIFCDDTRCTKLLRVGQYISTFWSDCVAPLMLICAANQRDRQKAGFKAVKITSPAAGSQSKRGATPLGSRANAAERYSHRCFSYRYICLSAIAVSLIDWRLRQPVCNVISLDLVAIIIDHSIAIIAI